MHSVVLVGVNQVTNFSSIASYYFSPPAWTSQNMQHPQDVTSQLSNTTFVDQMHRFVNNLPNSVDPGILVSSFLCIAFLIIVQHSHKVEVLVTAPVMPVIASAFQQYRSTYNMSIIYFGTALGDRRTYPSTYSYCTIAQN